GGAGSRRGGGVRRRPAARLLDPGPGGRDRVQRGRARACRRVTDTVGPMATSGTEPSSALTHLQCTACGHEHDADRLQTLCPDCGKVLFARYDLGRAAPTLTRQAVAARRRGMWRWRELLPVRDARNVVSLGEGDTPLLPAPRLGALAGLKRLLVKDEGTNPTGSFKARGISAAVSRARELGAKDVA